MFSKIGSRLRLSPATAIAVVALVFAMVGGAFAAGNSGSSSSAVASKKKPKPKRGPTGPTGPAGAPGSAGGAGPQGPAGPAGKDGSTGPTGPTGAAGANGTFNPAVPLAKGQTLAGVWGTSGGPNAKANGDVSMVPITFPARIGSPLTTVVQFFAGLPLGIEVLDGEAKIFPNGEEAKSQEAFEQACPGSPTEPKASQGFLCIYLKVAENASVITLGNSSLWEAANEYGDVLPFEVREGNAFAKGSWAATAG